MDVIESFFHVTIWAIFHNFYTVDGTLSYREKTFKTLLRARNGREMGRDGYLEADLDLDDLSPLARETLSIMRGEWLWRKK